MKARQKIHLTEEAARNRLIELAIEDRVLARRRRDIANARQSLRAFVWDAVCARRRKATP